MTTQHHLKQCWYIDIIHGTPRSYTGQNYIPCPIFIVAIIDSHSRIIVRTGIMGEENQADLCANTLIGALRKYGAPDFLICDQQTLPLQTLYQLLRKSIRHYTSLTQSFSTSPRTPIQKILRSRNFNRRQFSNIEQFNRKLHAAVEVHNRKIDAEIEKNPLDNKIEPRNYPGPSPKV